MQIILTTKIFCFLLTVGRCSEIKCLYCDSSNINKQEQVRVKLLFVGFVAIITHDENKYYY